MNKKVLASVWGVLAIAVIIGGGIAYQRKIKEDSSAAKPLDISQLLNAAIPNSPGQDIASSTVLKDGKWSYDAEGMHLSTELLTDPSSYAYGDVNGDSAKDMVAMFVENSSGSGYFSYLSVFLNKDGAPLYAARTFLGDRVTINSVSIKDGKILVDIITQGPGDGLCCATFHEVIQYKLSSSSLIQIGISTPDSSRVLGAPIASTGEGTDTAAWTYKNQMYGFQINMDPRFFLDPSFGDNYPLFSSAGFKSSDENIHRGISLSRLGTTTAETFEAYLKKNPVKDPVSEKAIPFSSFKQEILGGHTFYYLGSEWNYGSISNDYYLLEGTSVWKWSALFQGVDYDTAAMYGEDNEITSALKKSLETLVFVK